MITMLTPHAVSSSPPHFGLSRHGSLRTGVAAATLLTLTSCSTLTQDPPEDSQHHGHHLRHHKKHRQPVAAPPPPTAFDTPSVIVSPSAGETYSVPSPSVSESGKNPFISPDASPSASPSPTASSSPSVTEPSPSPSKTPSATPHIPSVKHVNLLSQNLWSMYVNSDARRHWLSRIHTVADIVRANHIDILTSQEGTPPQFSKLRKLLGHDYKSYPSHFVRKNKLSENTIFYKARDKNGNPEWQLVNTGKVTIPDTDDHRRSGPFSRSEPWVRLVHAQTGQEIVVLSVHAVAHDTIWDSGGALKRERAGHIFAQWANQMKERFPNALIVLSGDINQRDILRGKDHAIHGNRARSIPCIVGEELRAIDDIAAHRRGQCPKSGMGIDQVFTNGDDVDHIRHIRRGQSDHPGLKARLKLLAAKLKIGEG